MRIINRLQEFTYMQPVIKSLSVFTEDGLFFKNWLNLPYLTPEDIKEHRYKGNYSWHQIPNSRSNEWVSDMVSFFSNSPLKNYPTLYLQFDASPPIFSIPTKVFIEFWDEILCFSVWTIFLASPDGKLMVEMYSRGGIYSNFSFSGNE